MLMSIGYRFQQRLTTDFIHQMNQINDDDEFYQVMHRWAEKGRNEHRIDILTLTTPQRKYSILSFIIGFII